MNPLIAIAGAVLPDILKSVIGDKDGAVAAAVTKAVTQVTGTDDPAQAQKKIETDPAVTTELRVKLAQIAAEDEEKKRQAQLATLKAQLEDQEKQRQAQMEAMRAGLEDTKSARETFRLLADTSNPFVSAAPMISYIVTIGFFFVVFYLLAYGFSKDKLDPTGLQILNIMIGALAAAFATVVSFWLGSSQSSRAKDAAVLQLQEQQARQTSDVIKTQVETANKLSQQTADGKKPADGAKSNFPRCVEQVFIHEGGFSDHPKDPGGATNMGITKQVLEEWRGHPVSVEDVKKLTKEEAQEIYRARYWNPLKCDELPPGVDLAVFDFGVNSGIGRSAKFLQKIVGVNQDGGVGPVTLGALGAVDPRQIITTLCQRRLEFLRGLPIWPTFGNGWTRRVNAVEKVANEMVQA